MTWHVVAKANEIPEGASKLVTIRGRELGVFNVKGEYFALTNKCPHEGAPLCKGKIIGLAVSDEPGQYALTRQGELLRCPWHGWEFDIKTGQSWCDPIHTKVKSYNVKVQAGAGDADSRTKGPFSAETFAVTVDDAYVLVDI